MTNTISKMYYKLGAALTVGMTMGYAPEAFAAPKLVGDSAADKNTFSSIGDNIIQSIQDLPGLLAALAYMFGVLLGTLGIMKIKDHVENPTQTALKDGAIRLAAGGALFALPIVFEAMSTTVGAGGETKAAQLFKVDYKTVK